MATYSLFPWINEILFQSFRLLTMTSLLSWQLSMVQTKHKKCSIPDFAQVFLNSHLVIPRLYFLIVLFPWQCSMTRISKIVNVSRYYLLLLPQLFVESIRNQTTISSNWLPTKALLRLYVNMVEDFMLSTASVLFGRHYPVMLLSYTFLIFTERSQVFLITRRSDVNNAKTSRVTSKRKHTWIRRRKYGHLAVGHLEDTKSR